MRPALIGVLAALTALPCLAESDCPIMPLGVHEAVHERSTTYTAVAKTIPLNDDEDSFAIAEAEARLEAKRILMNHLSPGSKNKNFRGVVTISVCRTASEAFATLQLNEANIRRAENMQEIMMKSIQSNPTPVEIR